MPIIALQSGYYTALVVLVEDLEEEKCLEYPGKG